MQALIGQTPETQVVRATDTASNNFGARDGVSFCGSRSYELEPAENYNHILLLDDTILSLDSSDPAEAGIVHTVAIHASLDDYPLIARATTTFTISFTCEV